MVVRGGTIINIAGATPVDDPEYRYKMPAVFGKIEGSGNGIKTAIPNISDVASSLHRDPGEVNKFFGTELGAQSRYNPETDRAIVNGAHTDGTLQDLMNRYIEKFVLCPKCRLPETEYKVKNDVICHRCKACGAKEMVDMSHKLCNYILAENKKSKKESKGKKESKEKDKDKEKDKKKKDKKKDDNSEEDGKKKKDKKEKKEKKEKKDKKEKKEKEKKVKEVKEEKENGEKDYIKNAILGKRSEDEEDFGSKQDDSASKEEEVEEEEIEEEEVEEEEEEEEESSVEVAVDDEGALTLAVEATRKFIETSEEFSDEELIEFITNQQMASALKAHEKIRILVHSCITKDFFKKMEIQVISPAIQKITNGNRIMERHLIAALEAHNVKKPKNFPIMLKLFYDEDALEEDTILEWADQGRTEFTLEVVDEDMRAQLRAEAEPLVAWLQEAESEGESDSESS